MTFFHERHYIRYFVVQLGEKEDEDEQQQQEQEQGEQQQESERQGDYKQRLALLSSSPEALKRKDSKEINCMAKEVSVMGYALGARCCNLDEIQLFPSCIAKESSTLKTRLPAFIALYQLNPCYQVSANFAQPLQYQPRTVPAQLSTINSCQSVASRHVNNPSVSR
jgi:hypothetical protein